ncbi:hypothetical protein HN371_04675 [Candidatus Poribacteria bacterium]|jgi:hypothetical protein|nr:hypothetical protein [Candidatus Poribacteria bacterium]MBT5710484.1 hypothetical protein [Candidatus Poribacteria bacterium]MBT7098924.1 hypothetical protein [Candidatus Poribacteria bacterium]MBT7805319.1 hypothetical protein [Candidatus Poribacteria bacterium]
MVLNVRRIRIIEEVTDEERLLDMSMEWLAARRRDALLHDGKRPVVFVDKLPARPRSRGGGRANPYDIPHALDRVINSLGSAA